VGLLDADVYGPSLPLLLGLRHEPPPLDAAGLMVPPAAHGVLAVQSMGLLLREGQAAAWRGPMVMGAIEKLLRGSRWPALDLLLVDMPPGTGDAHISVVQKLPLSGALIVSTPQEVALVDARRGADLFRQVAVPVLGLVQNMAFYQLQNGERAYLFGRDGVARCAAELGCELLAEALRARVRPAAAVFGHIHEGHGVAWAADGRTAYINAASVNVQCELEHPPIVFQLMRREGGAVTCRLVGREEEDEEAACVH